MKEIILENLEKTKQWSEDFAKKIRKPQTIALYGTLGIGKSEIARNIIKTIKGNDTVVPSPTFTIVQNYDGISHFDLYRIKDESELIEIGLLNSIENDITLIEWPEIAKHLLPKNTIHIYIEEFKNGRKIKII